MHLSLTVGILVVAVLIVTLIRRTLKRQRTLASRMTSTVTSSVNATLATITDGALQKQIAAAMEQAMAQARTPAAAMAQARTPAGATTTVTTTTFTPDVVLGVAEVLSISPFATDSPEATLELDAIGAPKRRVTASLPSDHRLQQGDRVYVVLDPDDPSEVSIAPASITGVRVLPATANRLDALVLGPQILTAGSKAKGIVKAAGSVPMAEASLAARGFSKWQLDIEVTPERGWPYRAELTISLSTPEKAARIAHAGAEVRLRYDPEHPKTIAIDSVAMGFDNPYEALRT